MFESILSCRSCGSRELKAILSLGKTTLADALLTEEELDLPEITVPLDLVFCSRCSLIQLSQSVSPRILFCRDYPYYTSISRTLLDHFEKSAGNLIKSMKLDSKCLVIEAASNDGYMLKTFVNNGIPVLGIEPAEGHARIARQSGIPTLQEFFNRDLALSLKEEKGLKADLFLANNVLAHVPDPNGFVEGVQILLKETGTAVIEVHYLGDLLKNCEFDTIYHQHQCYFSVTSLDHLFRRHSLFLNDVNRIPTYGGSLRLFVGHSEDVRESVELLLEEETKKGMQTIDVYLDFAEKVKTIKKDLSDILRDIKKRGKRIAAYGAPAKATTLLGFCGIGRDVIDYAVDLSGYKQGKYLGGIHLPIYPPSRLSEEMPDYILILAWNFADEIMDQQSWFKEKGGKFIIPIPQPEIV